MKLQLARYLIEGNEVCTSERATSSSFNVVADDLRFSGEPGEEFRKGLLAGERFPVIVYLGEGNEKVAGEAFMYPQTPSRLHVGVWKLYVRNPTTGKWES